MFITTIFMTCALTLGGKTVEPVRPSAENTLTLEDSVIPAPEEVITFIRDHIDEDSDLIEVRRFAQSWTIVIPGGEWVLENIPSAMLAKLKPLDQKIAFAETKGKWEKKRSVYLNALEERRQLVEAFIRNRLKVAMRTHGIAPKKNLEGEAVPAEGVTEMPPETTETVETAEMAETKAVVERKPVLFRYRARTAPASRSLVGPTQVRFPSFQNVRDLYPSEASQVESWREISRTALQSDYQVQGFDAIEATKLANATLRRIETEKRRTMPRIERGTYFRYDRLQYEKESQSGLNEGSSVAQNDTFSFNDFDPAREFDSYSQKEMRRFLTSGVTSGEKNKVCLVPRGTEWVQVVLRRGAIKELELVDTGVLKKLGRWIKLIQSHGLAPMRAMTATYHDEDMKGRDGVRSARLSDGYRVYYYETMVGQEAVVTLVGVNKHKTTDRGGVVR